MLAAASSTHSQAREGMDVRQLISPPYTVQDPRPWHDASLGVWVLSPLLTYSPTVQPAPDSPSLRLSLPVIDSRLCQADT